ncbi:serine hydrolase [Streptomyces sp. NPDC006465]|uniref:serine hydrolase n=1 Tax=Streptomyces sp. NPDC006465 TaxID=3157174 RepID=UPI0033AC931C
MEEASVAGESPDRSKQHESSASSAEATPVTPAPVPSPARSGAPVSTSTQSSAPADPRMAMARERAATVRVDQATAVFSTKALSADASRTAESERTSESEAGIDAAGGKSVEGDTRLRAAVAAWVAGSGEPAPAGADAGPESADGATTGTDGTDADGTDADGADTDGADTDDADAHGADTDAAGPTADATGDGADDAGQEPGRAEEAADEDDSSDAASERDAETAAASAADLETDEEHEADQEPEAASGETASEAEPKAESGPASALDAALASRAAAEAEAADGAAAEAVDESRPEPQDEPQDTLQAVPDDEPEDRPAASARANAPAPEPAPEGRPGSDSDSVDATSDTKPDETDEADETSDTGADSSPEPPVDQPTAIFKAPRPAAVDQPTTMLKLGGATRRPADEKPVTGPADKPADRPAKADDKADDKAASKADERPADGRGARSAGEPERTSRFVPLKRPDEPAAPARPKPAPAPGSTDRPAAATTAMPQVGPERTTQQPLPPKPPLDLLAELTNTPPPPQTPVRTFVRRVKIWTPLVLLLVVIFAVAQAFRPLPDPGLTLTADETYTFDGGTLDLPWPGQGQSAIEVEGVGSLGTDGKQTPAPVASVAKIMTAYVILQEHPLKGNEDGEKITVDQQAEDESKLPDESTAAMSKGQQFTERQMLQMLMIPSGNNAARLLARWDSDSKSFVAKMNAAAKDLGMTNTTYTDPSGLLKTTVSTPTDQIKLAKKVMKNDVFRSVVGMAKADVPGLDNTIYNNNDLLVKQVGVIGLKTGSSTPAGGNLVWAATKNIDGKTQMIYGAVMNQNAGTGKVWDSLQLALANSQKLIDKVQKSLITATVVKKGQVVGYVDDQLGGRTPVVATKNMTAVGWPGLKTRLSIGEGRSVVPHSAKAGTVVGNLTVGDGSSRAVKIPVALQSDLAEPGLGAKLTRVG